MHRFLVELALPLSLACLAPGRHVHAQARPDSAVRERVLKTEYDALTDSTTRSLSAYAIVDTSLAPPDTFAVELSQRWKGRDSAAPVAPVELGLGRTRAEGLRVSPILRWRTPGRAVVLFLVDGARRIRLEQGEYASNAGGTQTFETARYRMSPGDLRLVAQARELRVRVGDRELWIDPAWRRVAAEMAAGQAPPDAAGRP